MTVESNYCTLALMESLYSIAKRAAGRDVNVVQTQDGLYVVEWFRADMPPPKGKSVAEALAFFIEKLLSSKEDPRMLDLDKADISEEKGDTK